MCLLVANNTNIYSPVFGVFGNCCLCNSKSVNVGISFSSEKSVLSIFWYSAFFFGTRLRYFSNYLFWFRFFSFLCLFSVVFDFIFFRCVCGYKTASKCPWLFLVFPWTGLYRMSKLLRRHKRFCACLLRRTRWVYCFFICCNCKLSFILVQWVC